MVKRFIYSLVVLGSLFLFEGNFNDVKADCEHTFQIVYIDSRIFEYEYDCDGNLVGVKEIQE